MAVQMDKELRDQILGYLEQFDKMKLSFDYVTKGVLCSLDGSVKVNEPEKLTDKLLDWYYQGGLENEIVEKEFYGDTYNCYFESDEGYLYLIIGCRSTHEEPQYQEAFLNEELFELISRNSAHSLEWLDDNCDLIDFRLAYENEVFERLEIFVDEEQITLNNEEQNRLQKIVVKEINKWYFREEPYFWSDRYEETVGISDTEYECFEIVESVDE